MDLQGLLAVRIHFGVDVFGITEFGERYMI